MGTYASIYCDRCDEVMRCKRVAMMCLSEFERCVVQCACCVGESGPHRQRAL